MIIRGKFYLAHLHRYFIFDIKPLLTGQEDVSSRTKKKRPGPPDCATHRAQSTEIYITSDMWGYICRNMWFWTAYTLIRKINRYAWIVPRYICFDNYTAYIHSRRRLALAMWIACVRHVKSKNSSMPCRFSSISQKWLLFTLVYLFSIFLMHISIHITLHIWSDTFMDVLSAMCTILAPMNAELVTINRGLARNREKWTPFPCEY